MPKTTERTWDPQQKKFIERTVGTDEDTTDKAKLQAPNIAGQSGTADKTAPTPPNTKGMSLAQAAAANAAYKKAVDAWLAKKSPAAFTAKDQAGAIRKKEEK